MTSVPETKRFGATVRSTRWTRLRDEVTRVTHLTPTGMVMSATAVLFWGLGRFVAGTPLSLIAYGLALVVIVSLLLGRRPLPLEGRGGATRARLAEGETIDIDVGLTAGRRLSNFILEERVPEGLGDAAQIPVATLESGETVDHSYQLTCNRRGVYLL